MVKKFSAVLLALVLCLSVVVLPASAAMPDDLTAPTNGMVAYLEWDKEYYMPGDEATLNVYVRFDEAIDMLMTGYMVIAFDENIDTSATSFTPSDLYDSIYKDLNDNYTWMAATLVSKITAKNTAEENALYPNNYLRLSLGKNVGGSHENASNSKLGLPVTEVNELTEAFFSVTVKVSDDAPEGVKLNAAMPSGLAAVTTYSTMNYRLFDTTKNVKITAYDYSAAVAEATIGEEPAEFVPLTVSYWKDQIRFDKKADGSYFGTFDYRILATIDNFDEVIGTDYDKVTDVGFIFNKGAAIVEADAKAQVEGGAKTYSQVDNVYVSTAYQGETYVISCLVNNIPDADKGTTLSAMAYVEYVVDGVTYYAYSAVQTSTFTTLYNTYYSQAFGA